MTIPAAVSAAKIVTAKKTSERINRALNHRGVEHHGRGTELARLCGVSPQAALRWINGEVMPANDNLIRIAAHYNIDLCWLLTGDGEMFLDQELQEVQHNWRIIDARGRGLIRSMSKQLADSATPPQPHP